MEYNLESLNKEQLLPVMDTEGAILVTAGAGSGKTRLLTHRIAYLITEKGVSPFNILAITFTNKAAGEMAERLYDMTPEGKYVWVSTFHSMCAKILRRYAGVLGYTPSFSIYAEAEKEKMIASIIADSTQDDDDIKKNAMYHISNAKNLGLSPDEYLRDFAYVADIERIVEIYSAYEIALKNNNAMDFDDLLTKTRQLLIECDEAAEYYRQKFEYIHVDEFQDTNTIQYELIKLLAAQHRNVCAVGDEDQCIYGWRGANIENISKFVRDFNCKIYKLEQNYRSTKKILELANTLIANNTSRIEKKLWTENDSGVNVERYIGGSDSDEADFVVQTIYSLSKRYGLRLSDFAILMRVNALTRPFEQRLMQYGIAHKVYGGFKFYDRKEIKDLLAYFRITANHYDNEAITRVINFPRRGIGSSSVATLTNLTISSGRSLYDIIINIQNENVSNGLKSKVLPFATILKCLDEQKDKLELSELMKYLIRMIDLKTVFSEDNEENANRKANINELITSIKEYTSLNPEASLDDYMQTVTLWTDLDDAPTMDCVNLATVHSAKGLEFKVVFIVGMEEGIFPISRASSKADIEEERRLFYVAITRAQERLYITGTRNRYLYGTVKDSIPSRFLSEIGMERKVERNSVRREILGYEYSDDYEPSYNRTPKTEYKRAESRVALNNPGTGDFNVGDIVRHKKFGTGTIISLSGSGISLSAVINFEGYGKMNIAIAYAPLVKEV